MKSTLTCSVEIHVNKIYKHKLHHVYCIRSQDLQIICKIRVHERSLDSVVLILFNFVLQYLHS